MTFLSPLLLWALVALPLLAWLYAWLLKRRQRTSLRYSSLDLVRTAATRSWRRHVPPALLGVALLLLLLATARPLAVVTLPWSKSTILLAMDVSRSMRVSDVKPSRMVAAQEAAKLFLRDMPPGIEVGIVTFAGSAQVAQAPTLDRAALVGVIDGFQMQYGTAIGSAIVVCLAELFPEQNIRLADYTFGGRPRVPPATGAGNGDAAPPPVAPVAPGSYTSAAILLLSDGRRTMGVDTLEAAKMAADRGVKIHVVGLGTVDGFAGGDDGMAMYLKLDEPTLKEVARMTGGEYHYAGSAEKLSSVYQELGSRLQVQTRETEVGALFAAAAAALVVAAAALSMAWFGRSAVA